jgi:transcriptional regulator with XRE-family HTH domain
LPTTTESRRRKPARRRKNLTADQLVADQIKALRARRGISQQQLADAIGETQSTIARIESGRRNISVSELLRLAWALDVAPVHLLAASFQPEEVPIQGGLRLSPKDARGWVRGDTPIPGSDHRSYYDNISEEEWNERQEAYRPWSRGDVVELNARYHEALEKLLRDGEIPGLWSEDDAARRSEQLEAAEKQRG